MQEVYDEGYQLLYENVWDEALMRFAFVVSHYEESPFYADSLFYSGLCCYFRGHFDLANQRFDDYLGLDGQLKHFEKVFEFKYQIAKYYEEGCRKHLMGKASLPRWSSAKEDAVALYDEIIATLPGHDLAAQSLFAKAEMLRRQHHYKESVEALQVLSRRFPKHTLSADSYLLISEIYHEQSLREAQNPDLLSLAKLNIQRFLSDFPGDERVEDARLHLVAMQETYADSLYRTGRFYERKKKPQASLIYYKDALSKYPETEAAKRCSERLERLA